jgi:hypothetical protein
MAEGQFKLCRCRLGQRSGGWPLDAGPERGTAQAGISLPRRQARSA